MRGAWWALLFLPFLGGCLDGGQDASEGSDVTITPGMAEMQVTTARFKLDGGVLPYILDLREAASVHADIDAGSFGFAEMPAAVVVLDEASWHARGACVPLEPAFAAVGGGQASGELQEGRYVVVPVLPMGKATLSLGGGPLVDPPRPSGSHGTGMSASSSLLGTGGQGHDHSIDGDTLVYAYLDATPNGPELDVTHQVSLTTASGACASASDDRTGAARHAAVWAWVDEDVTARATADALPAPPRAESGLMNAHFQYA